MSRTKHEPVQPIILNPIDVARLSNQYRLNSGCVCDSGCESCARLAEAYTQMREALIAISRGLTNGQKERGETPKTLAYAALVLAEGVKR